MGRPNVPNDNKFVPKKNLEMAILEKINKQWVQ